MSKKVKFIRKDGFTVKSLIEVDPEHKSALMTAIYEGADSARGRNAPCSEPILLPF